MKFDENDLYKLSLISFHFFLIDNFIHIFLYLNFLNLVIDISNTSLSGWISFKNNYNSIDWTKNEDTKKIFKQKL